MSKFHDNRETLTISLKACQNFLNTE